MPSLFCFVLVLATLSACAPSGIGDPCLPSNPRTSPTDPVCSGDAAACFRGGETYVETRAVECRTRVCLVDHWDQQSDPGGGSAHAYCSCRCDGRGDPAARCECPDGFTCIDGFAPGLEGDVAGAYCMRRR